MTDARRLESLQWRRGEGLGVRRAQDEEAKNGRELCSQSPSRGPTRVPRGNERRPAYIYWLKRWTLLLHCDAIQIHGTVAERGRETKDWDTAEASSGTHA
jgi:hypothetical protein